jgi:predicted nucleic acid-binding protein
MKVYLDNCCFNRPYDDQKQLKIRIETLAKLFIQTLIFEGKIELAWSYILEYENSFNKNQQKMNSILKWKKLSSSNTAITPEIIALSEQIMKTGVHLQDSLHIAAAIESKADYFISVDKRVLKYKDSRIIICNPIDFVNEWEDKP